MPAADSLKKEARALVIMATHDMEQVKRITDRVIRIDQGKITDSRNLYPAI